MPQLKEELQAHVASMIGFSMLVRDRRRFRIGLIGLLAFLVALAFWILPVRGSRTGLQWADNLFNQLAKGSADSTPAVAQKSEKFRGVLVDIGVNPKWPGADQWVVKILAADGISASPMGDGRVRIRGDLWHLSMAASADAELLFKEQEEAFRNKYGLKGKEVIYYWWTTFDDLTRRYIQLNRSEEADFTRFITTRVLEPSYNFAGIEPRNISSNLGTVIVLLLVYVLYTVWYGFATMYLFEGMGITATRAREKREI
ncbi:MAG: hypothetical protein ABSB32_16570 [Thermodesulfobacteriota bacterium]